MTSQIIATQLHEGYDTVDHIFKSEAYIVHNIQVIHQSFFCISEKVFLD